MTATTTTPPPRRTRRKLFGLPALFLLAAVVGSAGLAGLAGASSSSPSGGAKFNAATWKPTLDAPLPPMDGPLSFHLSDEPAYWYDNGRPDLERILHTRSLAAAVAGAPTKIKFEIGEPLTSQTHTVSSIVWPVGAKNVPFIQQGSFAGATEFELTAPGLYVFQCRVHPYMLGAVVNDDPATPAAQTFDIVTVVLAPGRWMFHGHIFSHMQAPGAHAGHKMSGLVTSLDVEPNPVPAVPALKGVPAAPGAPAAPVTPGSDNPPGGDGTDQGRDGGGHQH